ncbi:MAG: hypothetical protein RRY99_12870 [Flavobacterium sp.]
MTKKIHILYLFLTLGIFLMSAESYACGRSSEKTSHEKSTSSKKENLDTCKKECCKKDQSPKKDQHGCNGKCDHSGCTPTALSFSLIALNEFEFDTNLFNFSTEKSILFHKTAAISDGFTSIWLLPKIK